MAVITGTAFNDIVNSGFASAGVVGGPSTAFDDSISGLGGNDQLFGAGGNDTIDGGDGADDLLGEDGNDVLRGGPGAVLLGSFNDLLDGGAGNDTLFAGDGPDSLVGGDGNDDLFGELGADTQRGGLGNDNLFGGAENDRLLGDDGDDFLEGGSGADSLVGGAGIDTAFYSFTVSAFLGNPAANTGDAAGDTYDGIENLTSAGFNDVLGGDGGNNRLTANAGNDTLVASGGNDTLDGGTGRDTADYSAIAGTTTLRAVGVVEKGGGLGTDQIIGIERIVANATFSNTIDAFVGPGQTTRLFADLSANFLLITGIPFLGSATFTVENFFNVRGTFNDDVAIGSDTAVNRFFGTAGDDFYDGRGDFDIIDYADLGARVTLLAEGVILKDGLGTDQITNTEAIIGAAGFANLIDGKVAGPQATSFIVNLWADQLQVLGIPGLGTATFTVVNFTDVRGTQNNDTIIGASFENNTFFASAGNDSYDSLDVDFDTIDYTGIGPIAWRIPGSVNSVLQGTVDKFGLGIDEVNAFERYVGDATSVNLLDGQNSAGLRLDVDLAANTLVTLGISTSTTFVVENFQQVRGGAGNDTIRGGTVQETYFGSFGSDFYDGRGGFDQIAYAGVGAITLRATGLVDKAAGGIDTLVGFERISGEAGQANLIDNFSPGPQPTRVSVDLAALGLSVFDIPGAGSNPTNFIVDNFVNVRGTTNSDTISGDAFDNIFFGGEGNDLHDGRTGTDTIDYGLLGGPVTLLSQGVITKGAFGQDTINNMERIVGAAGFANLIDGTVAVPATQTTSFVVDLSLGSLVINGIPGLGSASFQVANFTSVTGTNNADLVAGDAQANALSGAGGNDTLRGGDGNDSLVGGVGADSMDGGNGLDTAGYGDATAGIVVNLGAPGGNTGIAAGDTYLSVEHLIPPS